MVRARAEMSKNKFHQPKYKHCFRPTPLENRTQVWFELQEEISFAHEYLMKMLPENRKIRKIYRGTYNTDV